jgi:hypothetical protein
MSAVQNAHPYETMTPDLFRQYLEAGSGVSLDDFFDDQVYKPGFAAFVVDSFAATPAGNGWSVEINVLQKLHECPSFYGNVPLDVTLVSANRERRDYVLTANGQFTQWTIESDIEPVMVILNGYNRLNQARTDFEAVYAPGATVVNGILPYGEFRLYLDSLPDTTLFRVDHIWSAPDSSLRNEGIYQFSSTHYWHVDGVWPTDAQMHAQLSYVGNTTTSLDNDLFDVDENNAVLIYREKAASPWKVYSDYTLVAGALTNGLGTIKIDVLRKGDYAFANGDQTIGIFDLMEKESSVVIFPNPVNDQLSIQFESTTKGKKIVSIFNDLGQLVKRTEIISNASTNVEKLNVSELMQGNYIVHVLDLHSQQSKSAQFQIVR